jgi:hypothetical protein
LFEQHRRVGEFKIVPRVFLLRLQKYVAVSYLLVVVAAVEVESEHIVYALHIHRQAFEPVCELARNRRAFESGDLLKICELGYFHSIAPAFPAKPPCAERRTLPVVFDKADVVNF